MSIPAGTNGAAIFSRLFAPANDGARTWSLGAWLDRKRKRVETVAEGALDAVAADVAAASLLAWLREELPKREKRHADGLSRSLNFALHGRAVNMRSGLEGARRAVEALGGGADFDPSEDGAHFTLRRLIERYGGEERTPAEPADPRPATATEAYFVTARKGQAWAALLGPYETHQEALARVPEARERAHAEFPGDVAFGDVGFGTARMPRETPTRFGGPPARLRPAAHVEAPRVEAALRGELQLAPPRPSGGWRSPFATWAEVLAEAGEPAGALEALVVPAAHEAIKVKPDGGDYTDEVAIHAGARILGYIATRDRDALNDTLHAGNKLSRRFFTAITGAKTADEWLRRVGYDVDAQLAREAQARRDAEAREKAKAAAARQVAAQARQDAKLDKHVRYHMDGQPHTSTIREFIDLLVSRGFHHVEPRRDGMAIEWWITDGAGSAYQVGGVVERDYALDAIEHATGRRPSVRTPEAITSYSVRLGQYDSRPAPGQVMFKGRPKKHFAGKPQDTKKEAVARVERDAASYESTGHRVIERAVVGYEQAGYPPRKWYVPVVVLAEDT